MTLPRRLARFNRRVTNPIARRFAGRARPFVILHHRGRTSGRNYAVPLMVFRRPGGYVIALTYGSTADWVQNVLVAGGTELEYGGRRVMVTDPRVAGPEAGEGLPTPVRTILKVVRADEFLLLDRL